MRRSYFSITFAALALLTIAAVTPVAAVSHPYTWVVPTQNLPTIQAAISDSRVLDGDTIRVKASYREAGAYVNKRLTILGVHDSTSGAVATIIGKSTSPPIAGRKAGFVISSAGSGSKITGFQFDQTCNFPVYASEADDVIIEKTTMNKPVQGITNWNGKRWKITSNTIVGLRSRSGGGGIGILIGSRLGVARTASANAVALNNIRGELDVEPGYSGFIAAGISLYAAQGAKAVEWNSISGNTLPGPEGKFCSSYDTEVNLWSIHFDQIYKDKEIVEPKDCRVKGNKALNNVLTHKHYQPSEKPAGAIGERPKALVAVCGNTVAGNNALGLSLEETQDELPILDGLAEDSDLHVRPF